MIDTNEEILSLYQEGKKCSEIVKITGKDKRTIKKALLNNGIDYSLERKLDIEERTKQISLLYSQGVSQVDIEKRLNFTRKTIREVLKNSEVEYRSKSEALSKANGNTINHNAFDDLKDPNVLYFIGLLYTDGHISGSLKKKNFTIEITLQKSDLELLEKFKKFLGTNLEIRKHPSAEAYRLRFSSERIYKILEDLGFTHNKTLYLVPDERLKHSRDFWRGCIDGDGCLHYVKNPIKRYWSLSFAGTKDSVKEFIDFASNNGVFNRKNPNKVNGKELYSTAFTHSQFPFLVDILYKDSETYMKRKYDLYLKSKTLT